MNFQYHQLKNIASKRVLDKLASFIVMIATSVLLSGCVTQNFENDDTPVVENEASKRDKAITRISLGLGYLKMGNMPQAKLNLEKAKYHAPDFVQVYTAFAHYYEKVGEDKLTITAYEKAISLKSDDADTLNNYGVYLCRQNQIMAAEKQFLKAIAVPSYLLVAQSYENLAMCELKSNDFVKAELYLNKAILHNPSSASTLSQMINLQYAKGHYQQAKIYVQRFEKATRRFDAQSLALAYKVYFHLNQRKIAKNYGTMLVKMFPQSWEAKQYILNDLARIDADVLAERYLKTVNKNTPAKKKKRVLVLSPNKPNQHLFSKNRATHKQSSKKKPTETVPKNTSKHSMSAPVTSSVVNVSSNTSNSVTASIDEVSSREKLPNIHVVVKGDNLFSISVKYNVQINALRRWNHFSEQQRIYVGNKIYLVDPSTLSSTDG